MQPMDLVMTVLRLIHIFSGIIWMGAAFYILLVYSPTLRAVEPEVALKMANAGYNNTRFSNLMAVVAVGTTLSGVLMYLYVSDMFNAAWFNDLGNIVLTIGAIAGIGAFGHGASLGRRQDAYAKEVKSAINPDGTIDRSRINDLTKMLLSIERSGRVSAWLGVVAIFGMAAARWL